MSPRAFACPGMPWQKSKASIIKYRKTSYFFSEKHPKNEKKVKQTAEKMKGLNGIAL
jgi:hypothetical protein